MTTTTTVPSVTTTTTVPSVTTTTTVPSVTTTTTVPSVTTTTLAPAPSPVPAAGAASSTAATEQGASTTAPSGTAADQTGIASAVTTSAPASTSDTPTTIATLPGGSSVPPQTVGLPTTIGHLPPYAIAVIRHSDGTLVESVHVDSTGTATVVGLPPGEYSIETTDSSGRTVKQSFAVLGSVVVADQLALTGTDTTRLTLIGATFIGLGIVLVRRRPRQPRSQYRG